MEKNKKEKKQYTQSDSLKFTEMQKLISEDNVVFPDSVLAELHEFTSKDSNNKKDTTVRPKKLKKTLPSYGDKRKQELSDFLIDKSSAYEGLKSEFDEDYKKFQADETRYKDIISSIDVLQAEWNAREKGDWHPRTWFNIYEKGSSMDLLRDEIGSLKDEAIGLKGRLYGTGGRGWDRGEEELIHIRKGNLERMSESLLQKQEEFDTLQNLELESKGY